MISATRSKYFNKQILVLKRNPEDKFYFSFGLSKAKLILAALDEIKKFVDENSSDDQVDED